MNVPSKIAKGVTLKWTESLSDYPASAWTLTFTFISPTDKQTAVAVANGERYDVTITMAESSSWVTGRYDWQAFVHDGTERFCVGSGTTEAIEDFASQATYDGRSQLQQIVDAMDAYLLGNASNDQQQIRFNDREIRKYDRAELLQLRNQLKRELKAEQIENELSAGTGKTKIRTRFI
jgi:hypothetical protein